MIHAALHIIAGSLPTMRPLVKIVRCLTAARLAAFSIVLLIAAGGACARPVSEREAAAAVTGWLARNRHPLNARLGHGVSHVQRFNSEDGSAAYYVVDLDPSGFVIVAPDDSIEPIIAFSDGSQYDPSPQNPLAVLVERDMLARKAVALGKLSAKSKWQKLSGMSTESVGILGLSSVSDVWVAPLVTTLWDQWYVCSSTPVACYNYYTPPYANGTYNNYYCGCVATAMAQLMRFHQFPINGIGRHRFTIWVGSDFNHLTPRTARTRGGDDVGGPYDWPSMTNTYGCSSTLAQRQAVGRLCYDAGVSIGMGYTPGGSGIDSTDFGLVGDALENTFGYANSVRGGQGIYNIGAGLNGMINPNLDAGLPVLLGIARTNSGHFIVCDGYGKNGGTLYHHLNMGWSGTSNAWYNLPNIDAYYTYDAVTSCIYNVYTSGSGEIISGRVTDSQNLPISGASIMAVGTMATYGPVSTNARGIFAIRGIAVSSEPTENQYTLTCSRAGYSFNTQLATITSSIDYADTSGNVWGVDFAGAVNPTVNSFAIDNGASEATSANVTLNNSCSGSPTQYMASESSDFSGAAWLTYSPAPSFTLSAGDGPKTVYFKVKNSVGTESDVAVDSIMLSASSPVTSADPVGGVYIGSKNVTLTCSEPATIYYTTDGAEPTTASPTYDAPIPVEADTTLRFFAVDASENQEEPKKQERYWILSDEGSIASAKTLGVGAPVRLGNKALYYKGSGFGYVEELSRICGIRVEGSIPADEDDLVCLVGSMTNILGEQAIILDAMTPSGYAPLSPFAINNSGLALDITCGLHVTTWGVVQPGSIMANSYVISDGSLGPGIRVITSTYPSVSESQFVIVTGAAGFDGSRVIYAH